MSPEPRTIVAAISVLVRKPILHHLISHQTGNNNTNHLKTNTVPPSPHRPRRLRPAQKQRPLPPDPQHPRRPHNRPPLPRRRRPRNHPLPHRNRKQHLHPQTPRPHHEQQQQQQIPHLPRPRLPDPLRLRRSPASLRDCCSDSGGRAYPGFGLRAARGVAGDVSPEGWGGDQGDSGRAGVLWVCVDAGYGVAVSGGWQGCGCL